MTDPFSVAAGAAGVASLSLQLLGGCIKGFIILSTALNFNEDAAVITCMLDLQEIQLTDWAKRAGPLRDDASFDSRINAKAVEETLSQLQRLLTDTEKLKKRYGLDIRAVAKDTTRENVPNDVVTVITGTSNATRDKILSRSGIAKVHTGLQRFWWATVDKERIEKLVADVHFLVRELWHLLDPWRQDDIIASTQSIAASMVSINQRFDQLEVLKKALMALYSRLSDDASMEGIDNIATAAMAKAYRIGLEETGGESTTKHESNLPSRQKLLAGLEKLSAGGLIDIAFIDKSSTMGIASYNGEIVFVEQKLFGPSLMNQKGLARAKSLAALLNLPKSRDFGSLQCRGIVEGRDRVTFVFHHPCPSSTRHRPKSLLDLFHARDGVKVPSLTQRIRLALRIACLVQNFHRAGWLHKSLRAENILFFRKDDRLPLAECLDEPVLAGFAFSRQDSPTEVSEQPSVDPKSDIYRHPAALGEATMSFNAEMDVYSLGAVLLEIAEWRALRFLVESVVKVDAEIVPLSDIAAVKSFLIAGQGKGGTSRLRERMGDIYTSATQICYKGKVEIVEDDDTDLRDDDSKLVDHVVANLGKCQI